MSKLAVGAVIAIPLAIGSAILFNDIGDAIETRSRMAENRNNQRLRQQDAEWLKEQEIEAALVDEKIAAQEAVWYTLRWVTPLTLVGLCATGVYLFRGWSVAEVKKAQFEATHLRMDPKTRTYPIFVFEAAGKMRLHDPNTRSTLALDVNTDPSRLLTANSTAVQLQSMAKSDQEVSVPALLEFANQFLESGS